MTRRSGSGATASAFVGGVLLLVSQATLAFNNLFGGLGGATPPNILLIIADDYGIDVSELYTKTGDIPPAPTISKIARHGIKFNRAWSYPTCTPTRASIITGQYGFRTDVRFALFPPGPSLPGGQSPPPGGIDVGNPYTLPKVLKDAGLGYTTAAIGKWHLTTGPALPPGGGGSIAYLLNDPYEAGFDYFAGFFAGAVPDYFNWNKLINNGPTVIGPVPTTTYTTTDQVNEAKNFIANQGHDPWFLWLALNAPHDPFQLPPEDLVPQNIVDEVVSLLEGPYVDGYLANLAEPAEVRLVYKAMIAAMDTELARLLQSVDKKKTIIVFIGDNGTPIEVTRPPFDPAHAKASLYQGGVNVPLIVTGPKSILSSLQQGQSDALVGSVDLYATLLKLAGINVQAALPFDYPLDSVSFAPVLPVAKWYRGFSVRHTDYTEHELQEPFLVPNFCQLPFANLVGRGETVRNNRYKLIHNAEPICGGKPEYEFYDLKLDPLETVDLLTNPQNPWLETFNLNNLCDELNDVRGEVICDL